MPVNATYSTLTRSLGVVAAMIALCAKARNLTDDVQVLDSTGASMEEKLTPKRQTYVAS